MKTCRSIVLLCVLFVFGACSDESPSEADWNPDEATTDASTNASTNASTDASVGTESDAGTTEPDAQTPSCRSDSDCDDSNPCTDDSCVAGSCSTSPNAATCDDGDLATANDVCSGGACAGDAIECVATQCMVSSTPNGVDCDVVFRAASEACDDGDAATENDMCDGAGACAGTPIACEPMQCEDSASLDADGNCQRVPSAAGTACNDGDLATGNDACNGSGQCVGNPIVCPRLPCQASVTPNGIDCDIVLEPAGAACDDGSTTTKSDMCDATGGCAGTPYTCTPDVCEVSSTPNGLDCDVVFEAAGTTCDDASAATADDVCDGAGTCAGTPIDCTPSQCEATSTPNGVGCDVTFELAGTMCDDADHGTAGDQCDGAGACEGTPIVCPSGQCVVSSVPNGVDCNTIYEPAATTCNDGNLSTRNDVCDGAGTCAGEPYTCPSPVMCQLSNTPNGVDCTLVNLPDGSNCSDNETCTVGDTCVAGMCVGQSLCGNGTCDAICGENAGTCSADCLTTVGQCDPGENACTDWADCHSTTTGTGTCSSIGCGAGRVGDCFCDPGCIEFGDCCQDMLTVCGCP